jgi:hypothetical protein
MVATHPPILEDGHTGRNQMTSANIVAFKSHLLSNKFRQYGMQEPIVRFEPSKSGKIQVIIKDRSTGYTVVARGEDIDDCCCEACVKWGKRLAAKDAIDILGRM